MRECTLKRRAGAGTQEFRMVCSRPTAHPPATVSRPSLAPQPWKEIRVGVGGERGRLYKAVASLDALTSNDELCP
jgi:hypothetical protein